MVQRRIRRFPAFFLFFIALTLITPFALAGEHGEWTIDIGKQLLAEGWEDYPGSADSSVVGYAIHFVELERDLVARYGFGFDLDTGKQGPGLWSVTEKDSVFKLMSNTQFHFAPNLQHELGSNNQSSSYDSWLITLSGRLLHVDISSTRVPTSNTQHKEERLEISLLPRNVDRETGQIESEITMSYETLRGTSVHMHTTAWVGSSSERPIAVVSREVDVGRRTEYQYFAVYLAGMLIPDELIPKDSPFIPMGTILGMQEVMAEAPEVHPMELGFGASFGEGRWGWSVDSSLPIGQSHRVYAFVHSLPETTYVLGVEGAINNEFNLVAEAGDVSGDGLALHLGVRDELYFGEKVKASGTLLPIRFTFGGPSGKFVFHWRLHVEYVHNVDYALWYQAHNDLGHVRHNLGVSLLKSKPVGARLSWSWDEQNKSVFGAGVRITF